MDDGRASSRYDRPVILDSIILLAPFNFLITFSVKHHVSEPYVRREHIEAAYNLILRCKLKCLESNKLLI